MNSYEKLKGIGLSKEFIYDGLLNLGTKSGKDMDGNVRGIIIYVGISFAVTNGIEKKQIQFENYQLTLKNNNYELQ